MISLPTIEKGIYDIESDHNNDIASKLFDQMFPNTLVPYEYLFELVKFLETTKVNAQVLPQIVRGVHNIVIGTGRGQVIVHVQKENMNVQVREQGEELTTKIEDL